jgi:hypothetical protein
MIMKDARLSMSVRMGFVRGERIARTCKRYGTKDALYFRCQNCNVVGKLVCSGKLLVSELPCYRI